MSKAMTDEHLSQRFGHSVQAARAGHLLGLGFIWHLIGAALLWWLVDTPRRSGWYNKDFEQWIWLAAPWVVVIAAGLGIQRRSWKLALLVGTGATAALMLECSIFVGWAVFHSE